MAEIDRDAELEEGRMPLLDHLIELRNRLMWSAAAIIVAFLVCYQFKEDDLPVPVCIRSPRLFQGETGRKMIATGLTEIFFTYVKVSFWAACCIAFPVIAMQIWKFVAPGLYKNERSAFMPYLCATPVLFIMGASLAYFVVIPYAFRFFVSFETPGGPGSLPIEIEAKVNEYLSLVMTLLLAFGVAFQLPVLLTLLARAGIITSQGLISKWRYAVVGMFGIAAVLTPPDVVSQTSLAIPLILLYVLSIFSCFAMSKSSVPKREAEEEAASRRRRRPGARWRVNRSGIAVRPSRPRCTKRCRMRNIGDGIKNSPHPESLNSK